MSCPVDPVPILSGLTIEASPLIPDGTIVWLKGREVLDIQVVDGEHARFWAMFGFVKEPPRDATGVVVSPGDLDRITAEAIRVPA